MAQQLVHQGLAGRIGVLGGHAHQPRVVDARDVDEADVAERGHCDARQPAHRVGIVDGAHERLVRPQQEVLAPARLLHFREQPVALLFEHQPLDELPEPRPEVRDRSREGRVRLKV